MLKYQQLILTLTILSFDLLNHVMAEKAKFNLKGHQAPEYASGPNGTMTKVDYINQFRSICDDLQVINRANDAIHAEFEGFFGTVDVSSEAKNGSVDCTLSRIFKNDTTMFEPTDKDLQERVKEVKHCLANVKDTELLQKFISLYESEYMLNAKVRIELFTAYGIKGLVLFKPINRTYFNSSDPYRHFQYGCNIDGTLNEGYPIKGIHEANFTITKKKTFEDIQFYINGTFDALSDLMNISQEFSTSYRSLKHQVPKFTSGPNETMTFDDYAAYFNSICANINAINDANVAQHQHYQEDFIQSINVSMEASGNFTDCNWHSMVDKYRNHTNSGLFYDSFYSSKLRFYGVRTVYFKYCSTDSPLLYSYFLKLYEAETDLNILVFNELHSAFGAEAVLRTTNRSKKYFQFYFNEFNEFRQHGCDFKKKFDTYAMRTKGINGMKYSNFTQSKIHSFDQIFLGINKTFDALAILQDYKPSMEQEKLYDSDAGFDPQPRLAKMDTISKSPLPFNPLLILLGSIIALVIISATIGLVACLKNKKRKKNGSFTRLEEDPEGNETNANPINSANAVIWSNDQLILIRK